MSRKIIRILLILLLINLTMNQYDSAPIMTLPILGLLMLRNHHVHQNHQPTISDGTNNSNNNELTTTVNPTTTTSDGVNDSNNDELTTTVKAVLNSTISDTTNDGNNIQPSDYVSDSELDQVMARVRNQSLTYAPGNYISDDIPLDELLRILESVDSHNIISDSERTTTPTTNVVEEEECPICFEPLETQAERLTRCGHKFHKTCLDKWIRRSHTPTCPECRSINF